MENEIVFILVYIQTSMGSCRKMWVFCCEVLTSTTHSSKVTLLLVHQWGLYGMIHIEVSRDDWNGCKHADVLVQCEAQTTVHTGL